MVGAVVEKRIRSIRLKEIVLIMILISPASILLIMPIFESLWYIVFLLAPVLLLIFVAFLWWRPVHIDVLLDSVVLRMAKKTQIIERFRVVDSFTTSRIRDVLYICLAGWRLDIYSLNAWLCSTAYGRATVVSTPYCSDTWLVLETETGRKYIICCEEKDREACEKLRHRVVK
ncbi:MAG: hypothetical protein QXF38_01280 [Pyrobaculum sp.]